MIMRFFKVVVDKIIYLSVFLSFFCIIYLEFDVYLYDDVINVGFSCWIFFFFRERYLVVMEIVFVIILWCIV